MGDSTPSTFIWARPQVRAYCIVQSLLYGCLGIIYPQAHEASIIVVLGYLGLATSRELLAMLADQSRAQELFSWCWLTAVALVDGGLWFANRRSQLIVGMDTLGMASIIFLVTLEGMYMRVLGARGWARFGAAVCEVTLFGALPAPWSDLGQPHEALSLACAHVAGELFVFAAEKMTRPTGAGRGYATRAKSAAATAAATAAAAPAAEQCSGDKACDSGRGSDTCSDASSDQGDSFKQKKEL